ncbi:PHP domain-containing protein [Candidatus Woesearchaeota archaeon]|nr:PHP domain-containing protein [Candidatus Woesearchaeota archaeon]
MLKAELHTHTNDDPKDKKWITYSTKELVEEAIKQKFDVLAITCHNYLYEDEKLKAAAKESGLILVWGIEKDIEHKHVLLYNVTQDEAMRIKTFDDLRFARKKNKKLFAIAAHPPYLGSSCLRNKIYHYLDLFDAWEHSFLHTKLLNPNTKMMKRAQELQKPIVGNSDVHLLKDLGRTYTLIDADKNEDAVFKAIRENKVTVVTTPLPLFEFVRITLRAFWSGMRHQLKSLKP